MRNELGKITSAEFGVNEDYPFLIGLKLTFGGSGWGVGDGGKHTINLTPEAWKNDERGLGEAVVKSFRDIQELLRKAKVSNVSGLKGKPVEVAFDGNMFKSFRILEEVL